MRRSLVALLSVLALTAAGCAAKSSGGAASSGASQPSSQPAAGNSVSSSSSSPNPLAGCTGSDLKTYASGKLTVATDSPVYDPWFVNNKPTNGKGYESAVAYAVAKELGFASDKVSWTVATFNSVIAPTQKKYDFDINEFSITAARAKVVDFSTGYYDVAQAVVTLKSSKYAGATTLAEFKGAKLAAQKGTTSLDAINDVIKPGRDAAEYPTNDLAVQALKNKQVDGLVVDVPTASYVTSAQVKNATIVGRVPDNGSPEQFGLVLAKNSSLTSCVSKAVDALRADGTLKQLQSKWLASFENVPVLK